MTTVNLLITVQQERLALGCYGPSNVLTSPTEADMEISSNRADRNESNDVQQFRAAIPAVGRYSDQPLDEIHATPPMHADSYSGTSHVGCSFAISDYGFSSKHP